MIPDRLILDNEIKRTEREIELISKELEITENAEVNGFISEGLFEYQKSDDYLAILKERTIDVIKRKLDAEKISLQQLNASLEDLDKAELEEEENDTEHAE